MSENNVENKIMEAKISDKVSGIMKAVLGIYAIVVCLLLIIGFVYGCEDGDMYGWFSLTFEEEIRWSTYVYAENIVAFVVIFVTLIVLPLIYALASKRARKLTKLAVSATEVVGAYTSFIPVSQITLRMPIEKIDNVVAVKKVFFLYTGKAIVIRSTSGKIVIRYVLNADEVVDCITETIKNITHKKGNEDAGNSGGYIESIKKLSELRDAGILTEDEFIKKKNELLNKM